MSNFALIQNNKVVSIVYAESDDLAPMQSLFPEYTVVLETKDSGTAFVGSPFWNGKFFIPQPYDSWIWNESLKTWEPPVPQPKNVPCIWDETQRKWVENV